MTKTYSYLLAIVFISIVFTSCNNSKSIETAQPKLHLVYNEPADSWENEALPLGNGFMGSMIFGGVEVDKIQINEHTVWSGGPGKNPDYNGGHHPDRTADENRSSLQTARRLLQDKMSDFTQNKSAFIDEDGNLITDNYSSENRELREAIHGTMGVTDDFGSYQTLSEISIEELFSIQDSIEYYTRTLDIDNAVATVSYKKGVTSFNREYFMNHPKNVMVIKYSSDKKGAISRVIKLNTAQPNVNIYAENNIITMQGIPSDHTEDGLQFAQQIKVLNSGGELSRDGSSIVVENADEIIILMSASTNYQMCMDDSFNYFSDINPLNTVKSNLKVASSFTYQDLLSEHILDYKSLYDNMKLSFGGIDSVVEKPTDQLLSDYRDNKNLDFENRYLELLYFQYGRYLLISSSREGTMPANLQGIWAQGLYNPWNSDYHTNINIQMNYWLAEQTNLSSCHLPMIEYIKSLAPRGAITAKQYYCKQDGSDVRGWTINHENNIWGNSAPANWYTAFYFPTAAAWCSHHIWEHYQFTNDINFLEDSYQTILDAALFWVDNLWEDERDGRLVTNPSFSPEHGNYTLGTSADQAIITELFDFVIEASNILNINSSEIEEIKSAKSRLLGPQIGLGGQFMEWRDEITLDITGDNHHRHVNHLHWLHPGSQIIAGRSDEEDSYVEAMKKTLETRGDGGTGWSKAWKINFWARLRDGNRAHKLLQELLKESTLNNLLDTHPPFQIDGNFGATAGVAEMLIQSQSGVIELLPSLPNVWKSGFVKGIKARGNFEIDMQWKDSKIETLNIKSNSGNNCIVSYKDISNIKLLENNKSVSYSVLSDDKISFSTMVGSRYQLIYK